MYYNDLQCNNTVLELIANIPQMSLVHETRKILGRNYLEISRIWY